MEKIARSLHTVGLYLVLFLLPPLLGVLAGLGLSGLKPGGSIVWMFLVWVVGAGVARLYFWALLRKREVCTAVEYYLVSAYAGISFSLGANLVYYFKSVRAPARGVLVVLILFGLAFVIFSIPGLTERFRGPKK